MSESMYVYVVGPVVAAIIGGIAYLVKYYIGKRDEKHNEEMEERNRKREEMIEMQNKTIKRIEKLESRVDGLQGIIIGCEHENCPSRKLLADMLTKKKNEDD